MVSSGNLTVLEVASISSLLFERTQIREEPGAKYDFFDAKGNLDKKTTDVVLGDIFSSGSKSADPTLVIPAGKIEKYLGKKVSGDIYDFLQRVYAARHGGDPLTLEFIRDHDPAALKAFRNRRRTAPVPANLKILTDPERGTRELSLLEKYKIDLSTPEGADEARRLSSAISNKLYPR